jgi:hypothetical protein
MTRAIRGYMGSVLLITLRGLGLALRETHFRLDSQQQSKQQDEERGVLHSLETRPTRRYGKEYQINREPGQGNFAPGIKGSDLHRNRLSPAVYRLEGKFHLFGGIASVKRRRQNGKLPKRHLRSTTVTSPLENQALSALDLPGIFLLPVPPCIRIQPRLWPDDIAGPAHRRRQKLRALW